MRSLFLLGVFAMGCTHTMDIQKSLKETRSTLIAANKVHARICAPKPLAAAQSNLDFAKLELRQGSLRRANEHLKDATKNAAIALTEATPCGTADQDLSLIHI